MTVLFAPILRKIHIEPPRLVAKICIWLWAVEVRKCSIRCHHPGIICDNHHHELSAWQHYSWLSAQHHKYYGLLHCDCEGSRPLELLGNWWEIGRSEVTHLGSDFLCITQKPRSYRLWIRRQTFLKRRNVLEWGCSLCIWNNITSKRI